MLKIGFLFMLFVSLECRNSGEGVGRQFPIIMITMVSKNFIKTIIGEVERIDWSRGWVIKTPPHAWI